MKVVGIVFGEVTLFFFCRYGPLVRFWCMRFEGKHNYFKDIAHRVKNYKNIAKTMAERHQQFSCYSMNSSCVGSQYRKESKVGPGMLSSLHSFCSTVDPRLSEHLCPLWCSDK